MKGELPSSDSSGGATPEEGPISEVSEETEDYNDDDESYDYDEEEEEYDQDDDQYDQYNQYDHFDQYQVSGNCSTPFPHNHILSP